MIVGTTVPATAVVPTSLVETTTLAITIVPTIIVGTGVPTIVL